ncbi:MAG: hypothetical protein WC107_07330, partial [Patescibacteria group bacterium]
EAERAAAEAKAKAERDVLEAKLAEESRKAELAKARAAAEAKAERDALEAKLAAETKARIDAETKAREEAEAAKRKAAAEETLRREQLEAEATAKAKELARAEATPDKEKLLAYIGQLASVPCPEMTTPAMVFKQQVLGTLLAKCTNAMRDIVFGD